MVVFIFICFPKYWFGKNVNFKVLEIKLLWNIGIFLCENAHFRFKPSTGSIKLLHFESLESIELNINSRQSKIIIKLRVILCNIEKNCFLTAFPVLPILTHSVFDSKSFLTQEGKIWCQNNIVIMGGKVHFRFGLPTGSRKYDVA